MKNGEGTRQVQGRAKAQSGWYVGGGTLVAGSTYTVFGAKWEGIRARAVQEGRLGKVRYGNGRHGAC